MAQIPAHRLLSLPDDQIIQKLGETSFEEILRFSLISEKCKELVKSTGIKSSFMSICIGSNVTISIHTDTKSLKFTYYRESDMYWGMGAYGWKKKLTEPQSVLVEVVNYPDDYEYTTSEWKKGEYTMKDWLKHLQDIFSYPKIDEIWFNGNSSEFDVDDIKEAFGNANEVHILNTGCLIFNHMVLQKLFPIEQLSTMTEFFQDSKIPPSFLMQSLMQMNIFSFIMRTNVTLNDMLLMNSKVINVENPRMPQKLLNNFIRLWQRGSNPHMEYLCIGYSNGEEDDERIIMKGIKHSVNQRNRERYFNSVGFKCLRKLRGGMDVHRMDGVKATITHLKKSNTFSCWEMYVWMDHCVVE